MPVVASASPGAPAPVPSDGVVSVLFADLVGFTPFAEERDAEAVRESLSQYFEIARQMSALRRHGREVHRGRRDGGLGRAHRPRGRRRTRCSGCARPRGGRPVARGGHRGPRWRAHWGGGRHPRRHGPGHGRRRLVNTAVPAPVRRPARNRAGRRGDPARRSRPASRSKRPASSCSRARAPRSPRGAPSESPAAFAAGGGPRVPRHRSWGGQEELALLKDMYHATGREGRARLVSVVGPAGIGKSRLAREFLSHVDAEADDFWLHHGRSPAYGDGLTLLGLGRDDPPACRPPGDR